MSEKRKFKRLPDHLDIKFRIISLGEDPGEFLELRGGGQSENISEGGMLFESDESIPIASFVEVQLNVPDIAYPIFLRGKVIRVEELMEGQKYDIGVMFTHYFEKDRDLLKEHMKDVMEKLIP